MPSQFTLSGPMPGRPESSRFATMVAASMAASMAHHGLRIAASPAHTRHNVIATLATPLRQLLSPELPSPFASDLRVSLIRAKLKSARWGVAFPWTPREEAKVTKQYGWPASVLALFFVLGPLVEPAHACSFPPHGGTLHWPLPSTRDVPVDTPIAVGLYETDYRLVDASGTEVPVVEVNRLLYVDSDDPAVIFVRPESELSTNATYTVEFPGAKGGRPTEVSFTTGSGRASATPAAHVDFDYVKAHASCWGGVGECAAAGIQVVADPSTFRDERPYWIEVRGAASGPGAYNFTTSANGGQPDEPWLLSVGLAEGDCVSVRVLGIEGTPVFDRTTCEPARCVRSEQPAFHNACGFKHVAVSYSDFRAATETACQETTPACNLGSNARISEWWPIAAVVLALRRSRTRRRAY